MELKLADCKISFLGLFVNMWATFCYCSSGIGSIYTPKAVTMEWLDVIVCMFICSSVPERYSIFNDDLCTGGNRHAIYSNYMAVFSESDKEQAV